MSYKPLDINKTYLITGAAGFIGFYLSKKLLEKGCKVIGIDNINDYYDVNLKYERLEKIKPFENFTFIKGDISDKDMVMSTFEKYKPNVVVNLAAQAGVRYSIENPDVYIQSNIIGFFNILEGCRYNMVEHIVYASSSSVYGSNKKVPFEETDFVDNPVSLYAATKKSNELMAYTYSHLYKIPATGLRFFTVYGPIGRPDMSYFTFTNKYFSGEPINIFNNGDFDNDLYRDFTYVEDIVEGIERLLSNPLTERNDSEINDSKNNDIENDESKSNYSKISESEIKDSQIDDNKINDNNYDQKNEKDSKEVPHRVFNIGNNKPEKLMIFITTLEKCLSKSLGKEVVFDKVFEQLKPGDVPKTYASIDKLQEAVGFKPSTSIEEGIQKFTDWYVGYYKYKVTRNKI